MSSLVTYQNPVIAIANRSSNVPDAEVETCTNALKIQVHDHFGPEWHSGSRLVFVGRNEVIPTGAWPLELLDNSDLQGAGGYHWQSTDDGIPRAKAFVNSAPTSWSVIVSHELLEMILDPQILRCIQAPDGFYALEACDPVESDHYLINGVKVSDFITQAWTRGFIGKYDYLGKLDAPLTCRFNGYLTLFDVGSGTWVERDRQGQHHPSTRKPGFSGT